MTDINKLSKEVERAPKTILCDIDGTLIEFPETYEKFKSIPHNKNVKVLPGVIDKLWRWASEGHNIILTTGRNESMRKITEKSLQRAGIIYDQLVMGLGPGKRYVINDVNGDHNTAFAINVKRNEGLEKVDLNTPRMNTKRERVDYAYFRKVLDHYHDGEDWM